MTFGDTVREARMREKITLRKFAEMVGVSPTYISQVERDEHDPPSVERIEKIAQILKLDVDKMIALDISYKLSSQKKSYLLEFF